MAEGSSTLGLDYAKITKNKILTEVMLEIEPTLIEYYKKSEYAHIKGAVESDVNTVASNLRRDYVNQKLMDIFKKIAPEVPLRFLELDKEKYPDLWNFGDFIRLEKVEAESLKLYKALYGKDYDENSEK